MSTTKTTPRFYRIRFADGKALGEWTMRVLEIFASPADTALNGARARPVIFVPLRAPRRGVVHAYVSESARRLVRGRTRGLEAKAEALTLADLPDGLTLLHGDATDAIAYEYRASRRAK